MRIQQALAISFNLLGQEVYTNVEHRHRFGFGSKRTGF